MDSLIKEQLYRISTYTTEKWISYCKEVNKIK